MSAVIDGKGGPQTTALTGNFEPSSGWHVLPVAVLRQGGFPISLLDQMRCPELTSAVGRVLAAEDEVRTATTHLESLLSMAVPQPSARAAIAAKLSQAPALPARYVRFLARDPASRAAGDRWIEAAHRREEARQELRDRMAQHLDEARRATIEAFHDPSLQEVLLLSNDAQYKLLDAWIRQDADRRAAQTRALTDTLIGYLQRVCTKNDTHSHFGPFTPTRLDDGSGIRWRACGIPVRTAFLSHWAAQEIASVASRDVALRDEIRPRRKPWALPTPTRVDLYDVETADPMDFEAWPFVHVAGRELSEAEAWLLDRCDGATTIGELRSLWQWADGPAAASGQSVDSVLALLVEDGFVTTGFEVPSGTCSALSDLRTVLGQASHAGSTYLEVIDELDEMLVRFASGSNDERVDLFDSIKARFTELTGVSPNRGEGQIYADRSVLFEECRSAIRDLRVGREVVALVTGDLTLAYDLLLIGPRLRMRREMEILHRWCVTQYGQDSEVPLARLYRDYFHDREMLRASCSDVDREISAVAEDIAATLLRGCPPQDRRVEVDPNAVRALLSRFPAWPGAMLNPDVMLVTEGIGALTRGELRAVIGDCHGSREMLTHSSVAELLLAEHPSLGDLATAGYRGIINDDEMLVDVIRGHSDKTFAQVALDMPDLELVGVSGKPRREVLGPRDLYIRVAGKAVELRAYGRQERLRLLAPPAGGPSIASDPLSVFAFPRHYDGPGLLFSQYEHVPRITCGRVVLARERWRLPPEQLVPDGPPRDDAAAFLQAQVVREALHLPDQVFAKLSTEPKALYIDWDSPLLVRQLMRRIRSNVDEIEFTEMLPSPNQLWLEIDGQKYTTELRFTVFVPPQPDAL